MLQNVSFSFENINANANRDKTAFQSKADHQQTVYTDTLLCSYDLELDPMTLMYELEL